MKTSFFIHDSAQEFTSTEGSLPNYLHKLLYAWKELPTWVGNGIPYDCREIMKLIPIHSLLSLAICLMSWILTWMVPCKVVYPTIVCVLFFWRRTPPWFWMHFFGCLHFEISYRCLCIVFLKENFCMILNISTFFMGTTGWGTSRSTTFCIWGRSNGSQPYIRRLFSSLPVLFLPLRQAQCTTILLLSWSICKLIHQHHASIDRKSLSILIVPYLPGRIRWSVIWWGPVLCFWVKYLLTQQKP